MNIYHFKFEDIDSLVIASKDMKKYHPDVCVLAYTDTLTLSVESINSAIFDARMISVISSFGGKLVDYDSDK